MQCNKEMAEKMNSNSQGHNTLENQEEFDYLKISDETDAISDYLEQLSEEVIKMQVECAVANIELVSTIEGIDFDNKLTEIKKAYEAYLKAQKAEVETQS